jgi:hypothetical protein
MGKNLVGIALWIGLVMIPAFTVTSLLLNLATIRNLTEQRDQAKHALEASAKAGAACTAELEAVRDGRDIMDALEGTIATMNCDGAHCVLSTEPPK